ncbi:TetR/AcrR family transcriptional regulator [Bifidobacterium vespertilionis]|uniref:TetR/AcrR family transcriptional regulator n=2 Tax=Bifidobacterium vespertilionis TaxID=2562524 RepID=A0A5J5DWE2_9BIFI|nr:TetR/AcrR family transcriptional regulator [Bifidobacterium vespertilionis]KAA8822804.1 TetR/AcrR family transcriptional regulator [Bifidobacterium vespertilionis]
MGNSSRMTSFQRREQLIEVGRALFAAKGFEATSVEEIATNAKVSKPIVYEHFGGKEGLYAVVVDREMQTLTNALATALAEPSEHPRQIVERAALTLLTYIEEHTDGFQVLVRDSPSTDPAGSFYSLLGDVSIRVEDLLTEAFKKQHLPARGVPYYAQMLVGMTVFTGQYWADRRKVGKEQLAAYIVDLAWHGLSRLSPRPELRYESEKARREASRAAERAAKETARDATREAQRNGVADAGAGTAGTTAAAFSDGPAADDASAAISTVSIVSTKPVQPSQPASRTAKDTAGKVRHTEGLTDSDLL